jgi:oligopeptide/dipeptide ABC transporter ATP-binding protein
MADEVAVMYAGEIVEHGAVEDVFEQPAHPYTLGLRGALPSRSTERAGLTPIEGAPPDLLEPPAGCGYFARCPHAMRVCGTHPPPQLPVAKEHAARCWLHAQGAPRTHPAVQHRVRP